MSILSRIALIFKGYITSTSDKLDQIAAEEELREAASRRKAAEELDLTLKSAKPETPPTPKLQYNKLANDYKLLGVVPGDDLNKVEEAWRRLAQRADPKRFPEGSEEEQKAAEILKSINEAYARIREELNPTEGRFGQLEL